VIVARHPGAVKRATSYAERLHLNIAVIHGEEKDEKDETDHADDGQNLPSPSETEKSSSFSLGLKLLPGENFVCANV